MLTLDETHQTPLLDSDSSVDFDFIVKILIVGDSGAGKTQLFSRFADETFCSEHKTTQSVEYRHRYIEKNRFRCKTQVWDCVASGSPAVMNSIYRGTNAVILCIDLTNKSSIEAVPDWVNEIHGYTQDDIHITLVGTKIDRPDRCISYEEAENVARSLKLCYFEVSSRTGQGVEQVFVNIVSDLQVSIMSDLVPQEDPGRKRVKDDYHSEEDEDSACCNCSIS